jgi:hypothetical protein
MALTKILKPTAEVAASAIASVPAKTIACMNYTTANTLMYLVPEGRKFEGVVGVNSGTAAMSIAVVGSLLQNSVNVNKLDQTKVPFPAYQWGLWNFKFKLNAGDKIYSSTSNSVQSRILGVEEDA